VRAPRWDRGQIAAALAPHARTGALAQAIAERDWMTTQDRLAEQLRSRPGRFVLNPGSAVALRREILARWPDAAGDATARADRVLNGDYDLLGYTGLRFDGADAAPAAGTIDWHLDPVHGGTPPRSFWADVPYLQPQYGDHKIIWELNRHQHWMALSRARWLTGDERYGAEVRRQLSDWMISNPPLTGVNWASMLELGFRSISWVWTMHALLVHEESVGEPWLVDMFIGLDRQLTHIEQNLSYYFSPNTHLTGEALALYVAGTALPELTHSGRWQQRGRAVLLGEIDRQICADGGHAERSTHYHRYTLDFYLLALMTAEQANDDEAAHAFREVVHRLAWYLHAMTGSDGRVPQIGDDDGGSLWPIAGRDPKDVRDTLAVAAIVLDQPRLAPWGVPEEAFWLTWSTHQEATQMLWAAGELGAPRDVVLDTRVFPDTGYVVLRDPAGSQVIFDVGPHGFLNGGHAHADTLAVTARVNGHPLLIDPGTATYTMDPTLRDRMRSSVSHNTLTLDGEAPSVPAGPFHWQTSADARLDGWRFNSGFAWAEGAHDGYRGAPHRRSIVQAAGGGTLIVDQIGGHERHTAQLHWHFDPAWEVAFDSGRRVRARHADGTIAWLVRDGGGLWLVHGEEDTGLGWCSPRYGVIEPTWAARITRTAVAPFAMITWIGTGMPPPTLERLRTEADPTGDAIAVRLVQDGLTWQTLLRPAEPAVRETRSCVVGDYQTNARVLQHAMSDGALLHFNMADGTHALALRDGVLSAAADGHVTDLHATIAGGVLEMTASQPLPRLRLEGRPLATVTLARLNGRELPVNYTGRTDSLLIATSAWGDPGAPTDGTRSTDSGPGNFVCAA
jgi:uncharacterized heparinase superfamily protein